MLVLFDNLTQATDLSEAIHTYLVEHRVGYNATSWGGTGKHASLDKWFVEVPSDYLATLPDGIIEIVTEDLKTYINALLKGGAVYYVKNGGDDNADGLSDDTAWAHHPWMVGWAGGSVTLSPGDTVFLKRGDSWVYSGGGLTRFITIGASGEYYDRITIGAYGEESSAGDKPLLYFDTEISGSSVIYAVARSYIIIDGLEIRQYSSAFGTSYGIALYSNVSPCHDITIINCDIHDIPHSCIYAGQDSYNITVGNPYTNGCADDVNYSNHLYNWGYAGALLVGTDPVTEVSNNKVCYNYIHSSTRTTPGDNVYGIAFTAQTSSSNWPSYCYAFYNYVADIITWHAMDTHGGHHLYFQKNKIKDAGVTGIHLLSADYSAYGMPPMLHDVYVEDNNIQILAEKVQSSVAQIVVWGQSSNYPAYDIYVRNNTLFFTERPITAVSHSMIGVVNTDGLTISGNTIYNGPTVSSNNGAIFILTSSKNVLIDNNTIDDFFYGIDWRGDAVIGLLTITNNTLTNAGIGFIIQAQIAAANVVVDGNEFSNWRAASNLLEGSTLTIINNKIINASRVMQFVKILGTLNSDYNEFDCPASKPFRVNSVDYSFSEWQSMGYDLHSIKT